MPHGASASTPPAQADSSMRSASVAGLPGFVTNGLSSVAYCFSLVLYTNPSIRTDLSNRPLFVGGLAMPALAREMSWLSPKRRRTTGNLKTVANGQVNNAESETLASPTTGSAAPESATTERPPSTRRPFSQPSVSRGRSSTDGNLFYAYARKVSYLLQASQS